MEVKFYQMTKRPNSTLQPVTALYTFDADINDADTTLMAPRIRIRIPNNITLTANYAYIANWGRYYYIDDWHYNSDRTWTAFCRVDVLASFKSMILNSGGYIERATRSINPYVTDSLYAAQNTFITLNDSALTGLHHEISLGTLVIGVIGSTTPNVGAVAYYAITPSEFATLVQTITGVVTNPDWTSDDIRYNEMIKCILDPMQFIVSLKWFPFALPTSVMAATATSIKLWGWDSGAVGKKLTDTFCYVPTPSGNVQNQGWNVISLSDVTSFSPASGVFPDSNIQVANYPYYAPFAEYQMITPWGTFDIDPTVMVQIFRAFIGTNRSVQFRIEANLIDGSGVLKVAVKDLSTQNVPATELFRTAISLGLDVNLTQVTRDVFASDRQSTQAATGALASVFQAISAGLGLQKGDVGAVASVVSSGAATGMTGYDAIISSIKPSTQSSGSPQAAFTVEIERITVQQRRYRSVQRDAAIFGNPVLSSVVSLSDYAGTGYLKMMETNFAGGQGCTGAERDSVVSYLLSGIYLE